jgi:transcription elongation factor GreB
MLEGVSKAFVNEDAEAQNAAPLRPARGTKAAPITPGGHARLQEERARLVASAARTGDPATRARIEWLERVLGTVEVVPPRLTDGGGAGFGCAVRVRDEHGDERRYVLVGPDEVDPAAGRITADSPVGRALLGAHAGDAVELPRGGRGREEAEVVDVSIADEAG